MSVRTAIGARRPLTGLGLIFALAGACLLGSAPARADIGVALDLGQVEITDGLLAGGGYRLPALGVRNPGDERAKYRMGISYAEGQKGKRPAASWFRFDPARFALAPGETRTVRTLISLPAGADPGDYEGLLAAQIATEGKGARVGAAAAARVTFTIEPSSVLQAYWLKAKRSAADNAPWSWAFPLALTLLAAGWSLRHRFTLTVARRA